MNEPLPWHTAQWERLTGRATGGRLPHSLLLYGPKGLGKQRFADRLAQGLLCHSSRNRVEPCGACASCRLMQAGTHPDLQVLEPAEEGKDIRIDQIRALIDFIGLTASQGGNKVAVIKPAEAMNRAAANSLLKTLEEPPPDSFLLLTSHAPSMLLTTIRSRCQSLEFTPARGEAAADWLRGEGAGRADPRLLLRLAAGSPLMARRLADGDLMGLRLRLLEDVMGLLAGEREPVSVAEAWNGADLSEIVHWTQTIIADLIRLSVEGRVDRLTHADQISVLTDISARIDIRLLFVLHDRYLAARAAVQGRHNLNVASQLEELAIAWADAGEQAEGDRSAALGFRGG